MILNFPWPLPEWTPTVLQTLLWVVTSPDNPVLRHPLQHLVYRETSAVVRTNWYIHHSKNNSENISFLPDALFFVFHLTALSSKFTPWKFLRHFLWKSLYLKCLELSGIPLFLHYVIEASGCKHYNLSIIFWHNFYTHVCDDAGMQQYVVKFAKSSCSST